MKLGVDIVRHPYAGIAAIVRIILKMVALQFWLPNSYNGTYLIFSPDAFPDLLGHPVVKEIAELYGKTPAQVMLHFLVQEKIVVIPKSTSESRLKVYTYDDLFYNRAKDLPISVRCSFIGYLF